MTNLGNMEKRQYQQRAIDFLTKTRRGIVQAPAGAGKTHIAASALAVCLSGRQGVAAVEIMVNTKEQVDQMQTACDRFPVIQEKANLRIYCAAGAPMGTAPDLLIVDECHRAGADGWAKKIKQTNSARWGLSATPFNDDSARNNLLRNMFGNKIHSIDRSELVESGHLAKASVVWHSIESNGTKALIKCNAQALIDSRRKRLGWMFKNPESAKKQINQCKWQAAQKHGIWENQERDKCIGELAKQSMDDGGHVIVLIGSIDHGKNLLHLIPGAELMHSKLGNKKRADIIERFRNGNLKCMVGTSAIEEGFDAPIADVIIMAGCGRSERKAIQATGRVLRPHNGKQRGVIHEFMDKNDSMLLWQSRARQRIYQQLNYSQICIDM